MLTVLGAGGVENAMGGLQIGASSERSAAIVLTHPRRQRGKGGVVHGIPLPRCIPDPTRVHMYIVLLLRPPRPRSPSHCVLCFATMKISAAWTLSAAVWCASTAHAAPSLGTDQLSLSTGSGLDTLTLGLSTKLSSAFVRLLHSASGDAGAQTEDKTIWEVITTSDEFSQLAHILNYSSDATKDVLKHSKHLTLFAPLNWHHHRDSDDAEAYADLSFGPASIQTFTQIERQIDEYEREYAMNDKDKDGDKEKKRELIRHLIDAHAMYHLVRSDVELDAKTIADNSSVATWLNTGKAHANNDGTDWRVRTGKSLLPLPAVYLNFYSRVVKPDMRAENGLIHAIKYPLIIPPDVLQSLFFGQTTFSTTTSALQKVHAEKYLSYRPYAHHHNHHHQKAGGLKEGHNVTGVAAETVFVPTNLAWSRLPWAFRAYLFSPWGYHLLQKVLMLHSLPHDVVYADFVHHISHSHKSMVTVKGGANKTSYTFDTVLPAIDGSKGQETVDVDVYRYHLLPGGRGPLQTRMVVQNVSVILQDIPASNGVFHAIDKFIKPKGHPDKGIWAEVAHEASIAGFGSVDLHAQAEAALW